MTDSEFVKWLKGFFFALAYDSRGRERMPQLGPKQVEEIYKMLLNTTSKDQAES